MTTAERRWSWAKTLGAAALVVVVAAGVFSVIGGRSSPLTRSTRVTSRGPQAPPPKPVASPRKAGTPAAEETPAGAVAVAATIVSDEPLLVKADVAAATALVDSWAASSDRGLLEQSFLAARAGFVQAEGGPFGFDVALLADRIVTATAGRVVLDVWCAEVVFDRGDPTAGVYVTERMGLVWTAGGWRLTSMTDTPGPSVGLSGTPTPAAEAAAALAGFGPPIATIQGGR